MNSEGSIEFSSSNSDHEEDEAEDEEYEVEAGSEVISEEMNKAAKNEMKNLKPDMASWALNSMLEHQFSKISSKPECVKSTVENVGNSLQQDVVDKRIVLDAYFNNTCCQSNVSEDHLADGDAVSQRLHIPIPAPRKSKSSVCSEEIHFTTSSKLSVPRFVPPASRCLDDAGIKFVQIPRNTLIPAGRVATVKCRVSATQPYSKFLHCYIAFHIGFYLMAIKFVFFRCCLVFWHRTSGKERIHSYV